MEEFTYDYYCNILEQMKTISKIYDFKSADSDLKCGYILRHDVDFNIKKAYRMCKIEKDMNVTSTYFILVTSDLYNILSYENKNILKDMVSNGFEIGLHFDPTVYGNINLKQMQEQVEKECSIIEDIIGLKVESVSLHTPSIHNQYPVFNGYKNAYSKEFFNPNLYLSDSCKDFRGKDVLTFIKKGQSNLLQVLFHPIHFSENTESYIESFVKDIEVKINNFDKYMHINKTYTSEIGEKLLSDCLANYIKEKI